MTEPKVTVHHADGTIDVVAATTFDLPPGVQVTCAGCSVPGGLQTGFFVDVLDPRLPDGPFLCPECTAPPQV